MAFKIIAAEFRILSGSDRKVGKWCDHLSGSEKKVRNWDLHLGEPSLIDYHLDNRLRPHETALRHVKAYKLSMKPSTPEYTYLPAIKFRSHVWASKKRGIKICLSTLHCGGRYVILTFCDCDRVEKLIILQLETFDISNVICWRSHCTELWKCFSYCGLKGNSGAIGISTTLPHHHFATLPDFQIAKLPAVF